MKKFLLAFMVINLLGTLSVWGGGQQGGGTQGKGSTTIRVLVAGNVQSFLPGEDENNNEIHSWLEKFSGYKLEYTILPADAAAAKQRLTLEFASGNPADMIVPGDFHQLAAEGYLMELDTYVANNAMLQKSKVMDPAVYAMGVVNKKLYGIPMPTNGSPESDSLVGMKQFTGPAGIVKGDMSLNHVTNMLAAAKRAYPDKVILTGGGSGTNNYILKGFQWLYGAFGVAAPWREAGGKLEYSAVTDDMKACLAYIAGINAGGYLDSEYAALNFERVREKMLNGRTVFSLMPWYQWQSIGMWKDANGNPTYELYGNAVGSGGRKGQDIGGPAVNIIKIPKTCKIPEAVVDYVAHLCQSEAYDFIFFGEKDIDYKEENGLRINLGTNRRVSTGTNYSVYYYIYEDVAQRNMRLLYADPSPNNQYWITTYATELKSVLNPAAAMPLIPEVVKYGTDVNDLCAQYFLKIATGALPVSAFDEFKARFNAIGGAEMVKAVNDWYANR
jgi:putative aldouronate transport system substrate-binding protein